jgi:hypothetical protein
MAVGTEEHTFIKFPLYALPTHQAQLIPGVILIAKMMKL